MNIYDELEQMFKERGYTWNIGGSHLSPNAGNIERVVDKAVATLYDEPDGSMLEVGRLIVKKTHKTSYDIFLQIGETR